ncbi:MAG TPA: ParB N-terminal domain-containing protein [Nitrososphaera sp.]|nr:ParB N-terminal domain-containing protein [Nitrososphaera sp.]
MLTQEGIKTMVIISSEYSNLVSKLSEDEFNGLKQSIKDNGQQIPIIINEVGVILDGHHRYKACQELGIVPKTAQMKFDSKVQERLFVIDANLVRRHLNTYQRGVLALRKKPILAELAKENMKQGRVSQNKETLHVDDQLAREAGMSKGQLYKVEKIENEGSDRLKELVRKEQLSISEAYKLIGKNLDLYFTLDGVISSLKNAIKEIKPGSEEEKQAHEFFTITKRLVESITAEELKTPEGWLKYLVALCGGPDNLFLVNWSRMMDLLNRDSAQIVISDNLATAQDLSTFESIRGKVLTMKRFAITLLTDEERVLMYKIAKYLKDSVSQPPTIIESET